MPIFDTLGEYWSYIPMSRQLHTLNAHCPPGITVERVDYGPDPNQYFLAFSPVNRQKRSVLFFLHGGGWRSGSPHQFRFIGHRLARLGYVTVLPGYRHAPADRYPAQAEDAFAALHSALHMLDRNGVAHDGVTVIGASAGAHLGGVLVYHQELQARYGIDPDLFRGFCAICGPLAFDACQNWTIRRLLGDLFPPGYDRHAADPVSLVRESTALPVLCIHGSHDPLVEPANSERFVARVNGCRPGLAQLHIEPAPGYYHSNLAIGTLLGEVPAGEALRGWLDGLG